MKIGRSKIVNRAATVRPAAAPDAIRRRVEGRAAPGIQASLRISSPRDPAEKEAEATAKKVMRMPIPEGSVAFVRQGAGGVFRQVTERRKEQTELLRRVNDEQKGEVLRRVDDKEERKDGEIRRKAEGLPDASANVAAEIQGSLSAGEPLPLSVRRFMEPRFRADFGGVRIHTDERAASLNGRVSARAFAYGNHLFFGRDQFRPEAEEGKELIAHELTHTIQQGGSVQREEEPVVVQQSPPQVQRLGIGDALDYFADKANLIPGFRMFTIVLGVNPINMSHVDRSAANVLRAVIEFIPGSGLITRALDAHGVLERAGGWVERQIRTLGLAASSIRQAVMDFLDSLSWRDIFRLGSVWDRAKRIFTQPIQRIKSFVRGLVGGILDIIRDAILRPLARLAEGTRGYDLLKAVLGRDPITGAPYPRNAETLIGGFMKLIGQDEVWQNLKRANAVARAWAWFQGALSGLWGFIRQIPTLFLNTLRSLTIADLVALPTAFARVVGVFTGAVGRFVSWAGAQVMQLLQIIFEVVAPGVMPYLRRIRGGFQSIIRNPIGFVRKLVRAALLGFRQFGRNFLTHLRTSLIGWLTGTMAGTGIYIPQAFSLREIVKFVLSVLGLTWQSLRRRLVRVLGERAVAALETGFDLVRRLVTEGPAAAWEQIQQGISNLREMVMEQIMSFVQSRIVQAAITRLVTSLNPAGAFVQAVIAVYNTIMFFVERLRQISRVATAFLNSMAAIASGAVAAAANRVEQTMGGLLTLVISFLARLVGLGRVSEAVTNVVNRVRAPIERALDRVADWIVAQARRLGRAVAGAGRGGAPAAAGTAGAGPEAVSRVPEKSSDFSVGDGERHTVYARVAGGEVIVEMASSVRGQMDLVLGRLATLCQRALSEYRAALEANPTKKARIEETARALDHFITITRKTYRGPGSVYEEVENIISGVYAPYDRMSSAQRRDAVERHLSDFVSRTSARLSREVELGFTALEGLRYKSGYVDEGGLLLPRYRANVRRYFYSIAWDSSALGKRRTELARLRAEAQRRDPSLAGSPHRNHFYWSEDQTGTSSMSPYIADMRLPDENPELDHKDPLGNRWASTGRPAPGNNTDQEGRASDYNDPANLQVISARMNRSKSGPPFTPQVGVNFRGPGDPP